MAYNAKIERRDKPRSAPALGGLGAGFFELHKDGICRNWNIFNNRPLGTGEPLPFDDDSMLFFVVRYREQGAYPQMKILQVTEGYRVGNIGNHYYSFPWLSGVDRIDYSASFPFIHMKFSDGEMPLEIELEAWSPFIPHDPKNSALPAAIFEFTVRSRTRNPVDVMLMASMHNAVGYDVEKKHHVTGIEERERYTVIELTEGGMDDKHDTFGSQALASLDPASTWYLGWEVEHPYYEYVIRHPELPNLDETDARNWEDPESGELIARWGCFGSIAASRRFERTGETLRHCFVAGWHFPNLYNRDHTRIEGHYYDNFVRSASGAVDYVVDNRESLHARTHRFATDFRDSSAPEFVLDQVNSHLNTFFTSSWFSKEGDFGIMEGMRPDKSFGPLATMDVSTYGAMSVAGLFPELHKQMMRQHRRVQLPDGEVAHGLAKDFHHVDTEEGVTSRLDMPSQYVLLTLLGYFWTDDRDYLEDMWPSVKDALDYVLEKRDHNGDCLPDMEGVMCSYDNFAMYGASSYVSSLWLGALQSAVRAACVLGDQEAEQKYCDVLAKGRDAFEQKLWTGQYYRLYDGTGMGEGRDEGCMTDQLIGQWVCDLSGLGEVVDGERVRSALETICEMSRQPWGLVNCRWPDDQFLHPVPEECWHDQANTCWTGVELAFASFLLYRGLYEQALGVVQNVDTRYRKWGMYWDHIEFGGHYYRPMSAWAIINGLLGLTMDAGSYGFAPKLPQQDLQLFFSFGNGTAHFQRRVTEGEERLTIAVRTGTWRPRELTFDLARPGAEQAAVSVGEEDLPADGYEAAFESGKLRLVLPESLTLEAPATLQVGVS